MTKKQSIEVSNNKIFTEKGKKFSPLTDEDRKKIGMKLIDTAPTNDPENLLATGRIEERGFELGEGELIIDFSPMTIALAKQRIAKKSGDRTSKAGEDR